MNINIELVNKINKTGVRDYSDLYLTGNYYVHFIKFIIVYIF